MSAPGPILGDVVTSRERAPGRGASRARGGGAEPITSLSEAEDQVVRAARDLAYLAGELSRVTAASERRGVQLDVAREECALIGGRIDAIELLVAHVVRGFAVDRAAAGADVDEAYDQAAGAIRAAEDRAATALRAAHATLQAVAAERDAAVEGKAAAEHAATVERRAAVEQMAAERRAAADQVAAERQAAADQMAAEREAAAEQAAAERAVEAQPTALERRLSAELDHVRRERVEHEERLRAELARATTEKLELRTRLSMSEHTLAERETELQRERQLADEAMRWASSVERTLVLPGPAPVQAAGGDCAADEPVQPPIAALRRRGARVRLRTAS